MADVSTGRDVAARPDPQAMAGQSRTKVLLISHDVIGAAMAGPGIRYFHLARVLSEETALSLALQQSAEELQETQRSLDFDVSLLSYRRRDWPSIEAAARQADVIILTSDLAEELPQLAEVEAALVIDGYDPLLAEWLALFSDLPLPERQQAWTQRVTELHHQYLIGDFYICASERQRLWWLGQLEAAGRLNPDLYRNNPSLHNLVDIVPYGLRETPPTQGGPAVRTVWPGIEEDDLLILWGGGLWPWLDPLTAIEAVGRIWQERQDVKLIFPGTRHPNPIMHGMPTHNEAAYRTAAALGLRDRGIFFGDWIPYEQWPSLLLECDVALSLHFDTVETQLAFRSRLFDYIWASLPSVVTRGDATSDLVREYDLGYVVDYLDVDGVVEAITALLNERGTRRMAERQANFAAAREQLTWRQAARPLVNFCQNPRRAPDRLNGPARGAPYYRAQIDRLQQELDASRAAVAELKELVHGYESGRVMRAMQRVSSWRSTLTGADDG